MPGGTNTISNSSTFTGWLEATGISRRHAEPAILVGDGYFDWIQIFGQSRIRKCKKKLKLGE